MYEWRVIRPERGPRFAEPDLQGGSGTSVGASPKNLSGPEFWRKPARQARCLRPLHDEDTGGFKISKACPGECSGLRQEKHWRAKGRCVSRLSHKNKALGVA